jgi:hypothetical protein
MRLPFRKLSSLLLAVVVASPFIFSGRTAHARYYDTGCGDYHVWDHNEIIYYSRWENQSHREHRDFKKRSEAEQKEYWAWRHNQK